MNSKRFAVILAGCGNKDGSEIHESVLTLLAIDKAGHQYQCFAPDIAQARVLNYLTNEEIPEKRNVLLESARIARSNIKPLSGFHAEDFDILVLPGGSGVAYNLCTFASDGAQNMKVNPEVGTAVLSTHRAGKPIGALCIAPVIIGKLFPGAELTYGQDEKVGPAGIVIDAKNKVVSTPCYMISTARISELAQGIEKLVNALVEMA